MVTVADNFGTRLKALRKKMRLSQVELGGREYTGSYISYLESGQRDPSPEVAAYLAQRLGVSVEELGYTRLDATHTDFEIAADMVNAIRALEIHDPGAALAAARHAERLAHLTGRADRHWEARYTQCRALIAATDFESAAELALALVDDTAGRRSLQLRSEASSLAARALRSCGRLKDAEHSARIALADAPTVQIEAEATMQLVAALAELAAPQHKLTPHLTRLRELEQRLENGQLRARVAWALGNTDFLAGDAEAGEQHFAEALSMLVPDDTTLWARAHRALAYGRLLVGRVDGVPELLDIARHAFAVTRRPSDLIELRLDEASLARAEGRSEAALDIVRECLNDPIMAEPFAARAEAYELLGDLLAADGQKRPAEEAYILAAKDFEAIQASPRAIRATEKAAAAGAPDECLT